MEVIIVCNGRRLLEFMPLSSCDENRLQLAEEAEFKYKQAAELVKLKDYARALEFYLFAFDNGRAVSGWGGVRLSYIPGAIADLGKLYPEAKKALRSRRNVREKLILAGETDFEVVSEWLSLNRYLHDQERELALLQKLETRGALDESVREKIIDSNFDRLLQLRQYDTLSRYFDDFGNDFMFQIFHYETALLFPDKWARRASSLVDYQRRRIFSEGLKVFELALGIKKEKQADEIAKRILLYCDDPESYDKLAKAAERAGVKSKASELTKLAKAKLKSK